VLWKIVDDETQQSVTKASEVGRGQLGSRRLALLDPPLCSGRLLSSLAGLQAALQAPRPFKRRPGRPPHDCCCGSSSAAPLPVLQWWGALIINRNFTQTDSFGRPVYILK